MLTPDYDIIFDTDAFAVEVIYAPETGDPVTTQAIWPEGENLEDMPANRAVRDSAFPVVRTDHIAAPRRGETITKDGETWTIVRRVASDGYISTLEVHRNFRPNYRR